MKTLDGDITKLKIINGRACFYNLSPKTKIVGI